MSDLGYISLEPVHESLYSGGAGHRIDAERASRSTYAVPAPPRNRHQRAQLEELERIAPLMVSWLQAQGSRAAATREKAAMSACVARSRQTAGSIPCDALR